MLETVTTDVEASPSNASVEIHGATRVCVDRLAPNEFRVRIKNLEKVVSKQPADSKLCWAACAQMVARCQGFELPLEALADQFVAGDVNQGANALTLMRALSPRTELMYGAEARADSWALFTSELRALGAGSVAARVHSDWMILELLNGSPVVVGLRPAGTSQGHACVVVGARFSVAAPNRISTRWTFTKSDTSEYSRLIQQATERDSAKFVLHEVDLIDPDPSADTITSIPARQFRQEKEMILTQRIAEAFLLEAVRVANARPAHGSRPTYRTEHRSVNLRLGGEGR